MVKQHLFSQLDAIDREEQLMKLPFWKRLFARFIGAEEDVDPPDLICYELSPL